GSIYVHCDHRVNSHLRMLLDEIFGTDNFQREIIWTMSAASGYKGMVQNYVRGHETILYYSRGENLIFNKSYLPYSKEQLARFSSIDDDGRHYKVITKTRRLYLDEAKGVPLPDVWSDIANFQTIVNSPEIVGYATQKPESLLERIIKASSNEGDLVADFFCGSGTTGAVAEKLGRRWIMADLGRFAIHTSRKRLLGIEGCSPFAVQNLGKYERQYWQGVTFKKRSDEQIPLYEYIQFILKLYKAEPLAGMLHLHGRKGKRLVHIGAVDAPVTFAEIQEAIAETKKAGQDSLDILGWEWEMGLHDVVEKAAKASGVHLRLFSIPRDVMDDRAVGKGEITFYELAYLEVDIAQDKTGRFVLSLKDFAIPNLDLIPQEVRKIVKKPFDYIDYWAVDWDWNEDTFHNMWQSYRTRKERKLDLKSDGHAYESKGKHLIMVKVIDIFGNDTTKVLEVKS
ncbi:MAG TPA: site-specific DNA-methyltransferase, partial [Syntrophales bacterium]|nr:site-specific DNA-methyltransferase [Syntrophales bacterium]